MKLKFLQFGKVLSAALFVLLLVSVGAKKMHAEYITFANKDAINVGHLNTEDLRDGLPTVTTTAVTYTNNSVISGGNVVDDGGSTVTARGICYGSLPYPDLTSTYTHTENGTGTGVYTSVISATGTIYVRAYATNANGTAYGEQVTVNISYLKLPRFNYNGLTYVVAPDPQSSYTAYQSWTSANSYCENLTSYGYSDWRMPTIEELEMMWQNRTSIGGFVEGNVNTYNLVFYHSSTYYSSSSGHYKLLWASGARTQDATLESVGYATVSQNGNTFYCRCHVRPIRVEITTPTVTTNSVTNIQQDRATCGGNVTNTGGMSVTERGICWSTNHLPTISNTHSNSGTGMGSYSITMYNLLPGTTYYVRAYAINNEGTAYGNEVSFITTSPPTVTTNSVTDVTNNSVTCGGNVISEGSGTVTARGVCWRTTPNPTVGNSHTNDGTGIGSYTSSITGLASGTQYYVRAYATNSVGTSYGEEISFTTTSAPTVTTNDVSNITYNSAVCGGNITIEGSSPVIARGVCWSTSHNPTTNDSHTNDGTGIGSYMSSISGLSSGTKYYVRAYAINSEGTAYGSEVNFTTAYLHSVTTNDVTYITQTSATCGGYVTAYNGATVTERGVCWSTTNQNPTTSDSHSSNGTGSGYYTVNLTGLTQNKTYYVRAYAISSEGTAYGETKQFKTTKLSYRISEGGVVAVSAGGYFYDSGGQNNDYGNNEHYIMTFTSNQGPCTKVQMEFIYFYLRYDDDYLVIYDGLNTSAPKIGTYSGYDDPPGTVTATNADGALTFVFISSSNYTNSGWEAAISIVTSGNSITASAVPSNGGTVTGDGCFNNGQSCTLKATPASGYFFSKWTKNGTQVSTNANYTFTVYESANYMAHFSPNYIVSVSANPGEGGTVTGGGSFSNGQSCTVKATPASGYAFVNWTENGSVLSSNSQYTFTVNNNRNLVANFLPLSQMTYSIGATANPSAGGSVSGAGTYNYGASCTLTATPATGYTFTKWTKNGTQVSTSASYTFTVSENASYVAQFSPNSYNITTTANPTTGGSTIVGSITQTYNFDDSTLGVWTTIDADGDGEAWYGTIGTGHEGSLGMVSSASWNGSALTPDNYLVSPKVSVTEQSKTFSFWASAQDASWAFEHFGVAVSTTNNTSASAFTTIQEWDMTAKNAVKEAKPMLRGQNRGQGNWYEYSVDLSAYIGQNVYIAIRHFNCTDMYWLNVDDITTPNTSETSSSGVFNHGTSCTIKATANLGYSFVNWTKNGTQVSTNASYTFTVTENANYVAHFSLNSYQVTATANPTTGGSVSGTGTYNHGTSCTLTATPATGYSFTKWTKNGTQVSTNANYTFTVIGNASYVAHFSLNNYAITATANPSNGGTVSGAGAYNHGSSCTLTATPATGYTFAKWTKDGMDISTNESFTFTVTENASYVAHFTPNSYTIAVTAEPFVGGSVNGAGSYDYNSECTLTATAANGYTFTKWTKDGTDVSNNASYTFTVTGNASYVAHFSQNYTVSVSASPTNGGTATGGGTYYDGQSCTVSAAPAIGYSFVSWKENGVLVSTSTDYTFTVTGNRNLVANFSSEAYTITATANPAEGGSVSGADTFIYGITATLTATANTGYTFVKWTKNGVVVSTSATYTFTVTESGDYIANFSLNNYEITATANPTEGGTIDGADTYGYGSTATLTATANEGYHFVNWTKNGIEVSAESSYSFTVIEAGNYVANFELNSYEVTATANPAAGGTIEGADTYVYGSTATLIATPNQNYVFDNWTENGVVVSVDSSYSFTVTANRALVANFTFIDGIGEQNGIEANIYPNPTNGKITVEAENLRRVSVFNTLGQKVFEASASGNNTECDLRGCAIGVYSMQIETTSGIVTKRVVVEK